MVHLGLGPRVGSAAARRPNSPSVAEPERFARSPVLPSRSLSPSVRLAAPQPAEPALQRCLTPTVLVPESFRGAVAPSAPGVTRRLACPELSRRRSTACQPLTIALTPTPASRASA